MPTGRMVRVTTVGDPIEARIIAARLGSEGLLWELRGGVSGPYPMGPVHVYVEEHELEVANELINVPADVSLDDEDGHGEAESSRAPLALWVVVLAIVAVAAFGIARVAAGGGMAPPPPPNQPLPTTTLP